MAIPDYAAEASRTSTEELRRVLARLPVQAVAQRHAIETELQARGERPPGYRLGEKGHRCGNCECYRGRRAGRCSKFERVVMAVRVCDLWERAKR